MGSHRRRHNLRNFRNPARRILDLHSLVTQIVGARHAVQAIHEHRGEISLTVGAPLAAPQLFAMSDARSRRTPLRELLRSPVQLERRPIEWPTIDAAGM